MTIFIDEIRVGDHRAGDGPLLLPPKSLDGAGPQHIFLLGRVFRAPPVLVPHLGYGLWFVLLVGICCRLALIEEAFWVQSRPHLVTNIDNSYNHLTIVGKGKEEESEEKREGYLNCVVLEERVIKGRLMSDMDAVNCISIWTLDAER